MINERNLQGFKNLEGLIKRKRPSGFRRTWKSLNKKNKTIFQCNFYLCNSVILNSRIYATDISCYNNFK